MRKKNNRKMKIDVHHQRQLQQEEPQEFVNEQHIVLHQEFKRERTISIW